MIDAGLLADALDAGTFGGSRRVRLLALGLAALGALGLVLGFVHDRANGFTALHVAAVLVLGIGGAGGLLSAVFQLTGARWGRSVRRLAEAGMVFAPIAYLALLVLVACGGSYLPFLREPPDVGGKVLWLLRGFWSARVLLVPLLALGASAVFAYHSLARDLAVPGVAARFPGRLARIARGGGDAEIARREAILCRLAPAVVIVNAVALSLFGFDFVMALEPDFASTLFGLWSFFGGLLAGLALLAVVVVTMAPRALCDRFFGERRQCDLATLLFAFCLVHMDFFWSQFLTIWYGNLPDETSYVLARTAPGSPLASLSWLSLVGFFGLPFVALLFRRVKRSRVLLVAVAAVAALGVLLARFVEIAPPILRLAPGTTGSAVVLPLVVTLLVVAGFLGVGLLLYERLLRRVPLLPVGDPIFWREEKPRAAVSTEGEAA